MDFLSVISLHNRLCYLTLKSFNSASSNVQYLDFPNGLVASELSRLFILEDMGTITLLY